jgi:cleavage stimulation factor subunit 3
LELKYSNFNEVEALFTRCLKTVLSVDLWKFYLGYIRRINLRESGSAVTPEARSIIEKAYEYVLSNVGIDKEAGPIWADYIYFLRSAEVNEKKKIIFLSETMIIDINNT